MDASVMAGSRTAAKSLAKIGFCLAILLTAVTGESKELICFTVRNVIPFLDDAPLHTQLVFTAVTSRFSV